MTAITTRSVAQHESEWIYSTFITKKLNLSSINDHIHQLPHVPLIAELYIFLCGYAFNPTMVPIWLGLVNIFTITGVTDAATVEFNSNSGTMIDKQWINFLMTIESNKRGHVNMIFYLGTVLVTLVFTELGKASFATTRPKIPSTGYSTILHEQSNGDNDNNYCSTIKWKRRFGSIVASLKSKHSFPSGDSAQAMNLCLFFLRYIPTTTNSLTSGQHTIPLRDIFLFMIFLPGVAFARVFYLCHWIEDCIGGFSLSLLIHWLVIPVIREYLVDLTRSFALI